jgi:hypothetical protein
MLFAVVRMFHALPPPNPAIKETSIFLFLPAKFAAGIETLLISSIMRAWVEPILLAAKKA